MSSSGQPATAPAGPDRPEIGSFFEWPLSSVAPLSAAATERTPWGAAGILTGSGRGALEIAVRASECTELLVPDYFCHETLASIADLAALRTYQAVPFMAPNFDGVPITGSTAVLVCNLFGLGFGRDSVAGLQRRGAVVIEDHTHDPLGPWAAHSDADFAFASLRKWYPIPDGGVTWSPRSRPFRKAEEALLPPLPDAVAAGVLAMLLKRLYLAGFGVDKRAYLDLRAKADEVLESSGPRSMSELSRVLLQSMPGALWRDKRTANVSRARAALTGLPGLALAPSGDHGAAFGLLLLTDSSDTRVALATALINRDCYPAVLWDLHPAPGCAVSAESRDVSERLLFVHCDHRYSGAEVDGVCADIRAFFIARETGK